MPQKICICGAGTMGSGIAQVAAQSGFDTLLYDLDASMTEKAAKDIDKSLQGLMVKNKIDSSQKQAILNRLHFTNDIVDCIADIFIEAIAEKITVKLELFNQLATINPGTVVFATNTSSLSVTTLAEKISFPGRVIGMHFFNPAPLMQLVEVVNSTYTSQETTQVIMELAGRMGKTAVLCKDAPGFIVNHVARPYYLESLHMLEQGISDVENIDNLLEATGFRMGPFRLMDLIGNDINYAVSCSVYEALGEPIRLRPPVIQEQKVIAKEWGRKTGKGYYEYPLKS